MEYRTNEQIAARARQLAPVSDADIEQLTALLEGVRSASDLMASLIQPFEREIDVSAMSKTVEGPAETNESAGDTK